MPTSREPRSTAHLSNRRLTEHRLQGEAHIYLPAAARTHCFIFNTATVPAVSAEWESMFEDGNKAALEAILPRFLRARRWFGGKARPIQSAEIVDVVPIHHASPTAYVALVQVEYTEGDPETYVLLLAFASAEAEAAGGVLIVEQF